MDDIMQTKDINNQFTLSRNSIIDSPPELANLPHFNQKIDNKEYIINDSLPFKTNLKFSLMPVAFSLFNFILDIFQHDPNKGIFFLGHLIFISICSLISGLLINYYRKIGNPVIIFNREKGTVTFPEGFKKIPVTYNFNDTIMFISYGTPQLGGQYLGIKPKGKVKGYNIAGIVQDSHKSFILWYMDKNRPLPPGDLFSPYRNEDAKRLRDLGHPPPLHPMTREIKELTKEFYEQALNADLIDEAIYNGDPGTEPKQASGFYTYRKPNDLGKGFPKLKPEDRSIF